MAQNLLIITRKLGVLWNAYKDRLGISEFTDIFYELSELIQPSFLPCLDDPFTLDELLDILKDMPPDHALGPDGFNEVFFK
jgi:hypothetical protein